MAHHLIIAAAAALFLITAPSALADQQVPTPDPLNQMRAEHVMISTDDYDATVRWYRTVLGFEVAHEWTVPELPGLKLGYLEKNGFVLEVVETPQARSRLERPANLGEALNDRIIGHFAFLVTDVDAVAAVLKARRVEFLVEPTSFPDAERRVIFIYDNNGYVIEFLTPLSAYDQN